MAIDLFPTAEKYTLLKKEPLIFRLKKKPGGHPVYMYMDNPNDFAFGGNKVRFYEYLIPEIKESGADWLITTGSIYSNHVRVTAEVAKLLGLKCKIVITEEYPGDEYFENETNLSIAIKLGAEVTYAGSFAAILKTEEYKKEMTRDGIKFYHVPNAGHSRQAVMAYANVFATSIERLAIKGVIPEKVFLPVSSGTTMSGILVGRACLKAMGAEVPDVIAYAVGNTVNGARKAVKAYIADADIRTIVRPDVSKAITQKGGTVGDESTEIEPELVTDDDIDVRDCGKNNYGKPDSFLLGMRSGVRRDEGVTLDPTYNTNAFYGMLYEIEHHTGNEPILYINTGGYTGFDEHGFRPSLFSSAF